MADRGIFHAGDKVLLVSSPDVGKRAAQHIRVIEAARGAGVGVLAYTSLLRSDTSRLSIEAEHKTTEDAIRDSGVPSVFLRNGWYVERTSTRGPKNNVVDNLGLSRLGAHPWPFLLL